MTHRFPRFIHSARRVRFRSDCILGCHLSVQDDRGFDAAQYEFFNIGGDETIGGLEDDLEGALEVSESQPFLPSHSLLPYRRKRAGTILAIIGLPAGD